MPNTKHSGVTRTHRSQARMGASAWAPRHRTRLGEHGGGWGAPGPPRAALFTRGCPPASDATGRLWLREGSSWSSSGSSQQPGCVGKGLPDLSWLGLPPPHHASFPLPLPPLGLPPVFLPPPPCPFPTLVSSVFYHLYSVSCNSSSFLSLPQSLSCTLLHHWLCRPM